MILPPIDEDLLLALLNTTPVIEGEQRDDLANREDGLRWLGDHGQPASAKELQAAVEVRSALQSIIRGNQPASTVAPFIAGISYEPAIDGEGIAWNLNLPAGRTAAAKAVLAWDALRVSSPGRLRPCANPECRLFLIDHSKPNTARWCSMAVCGNRMKARRHYERTKDAAVR